MATLGGTGDRLQDFKITTKEVNQLKEALKDAEFRKLLIEYSQEINDPKSLQNRESEIIEFERQLGHEVDFIEPFANYVIKTFNEKGGKVLINVCTSLKVQELTSDAYDEQLKGNTWNIPYVTGNKRREVDRKNQICDAVDVIFHDKTIQLSRACAAFQKIVHTSALEGAENILQCHLQREHLKFPKLKYKGVVQKCMIRNSPVTPRHELVYRENSFGVKIALLLKIKLPLLSTARDCSLVVTDTSVQLRHHNYALDVNLPMKINSDAGTAKFDTHLKTLVLELPTYEAATQLLSLPLSNSIVNNILNQPMESAMNRLAEECQVMALDSASDEAAESSDCDNMKKQAESGVDNQLQLEERQPSSSACPATAQAIASSNNNYWNQDCKPEAGDKKVPPRRQAMKTRSFSESSDDWSVSHSPCKGILKSWSISSAMSISLEGTSELCEQGNGELAVSSASHTGSVKKSVSFSDVISKQLFRADSSILGQRKKNQRRARNKRKSANRRTNSESEDVLSETDTASCAQRSSAPEILSDIKGSNKNIELTSDLMFEIDM